MLTHPSRLRTAGSPSKALLLASLGTACCLLTPWAMAVNFVTNCADQGVGSLRDAILQAPENGVVDATGLANVCSVITVKTGDIQVGVNDLTILGPGADKLFVSALYLGAHTFHHYQSRIFNHTGTGTLTLENLSVSEGLIKPTGTSQLFGGCIYSKGNVSLLQSTVSYCTISSTANGDTGGGGIDALGKVYLLNSQINGNIVNGVTKRVSGGGVRSGSFEAHGSTISGNALTGGSDIYSVALGGGLSISGSIDLENSTVSGNSASGGKPIQPSGAQSASAGGVSSYGTATIRNSTISGNSAGAVGGGIVARVSGTITLLNSTIAFNSSGYTNAAGAVISATNFDVESNILSNNTSGSGAATNDLQASVTGTLTGSHNLVFATSANVPADTVIGKCARLGPLRNNGGPMLTHALLSRSPALNAGSNPASLSNDQRGPPYPRTLGSSTDIGAYELNPADIIFNSGFDGC